MIRLNTINTVNTIRPGISRLVAAQRHFSSGPGLHQKISETDHAWDFLTGKESESEKDDTFSQKQQDKAPTSSEFHVSRPFQDKEVSGPTSTQKERQIFSKIFESILSQTESSKPKTASNKSKGLSSNIQALFQQAKNDSQQEYGVNLEMTSHTARNRPLTSILGGSYAADVRRAPKNDLEAQLVQPILNYIYALPTDEEVVEFYSTYVLDRYDNPTVAAAKASSPTKAGSNKSKAKSTSANKSHPILDNLVLSEERLPIYLLHCMKALVNNFREPVEALSLFEMSKRKSIEFYSESCSADVYNYVLLLRWNYYRDLYAVESLVSELLVNAVLGNNETLEVLDKIFRDIIDAKHGMLESNNIALWNQEDEERLKKLQNYKTRIFSALNTHASPLAFGHGA